jgi:hypothetical protein
MTGLTVSSAKYWIDASTVGANWETTGFDDSSWTAAPSPRSGSLVDLYQYTSLGLGANIGSVAGLEADGANVFIRFTVPAAVSLRLVGSVDDWIHTLYINGSSAYTETSQASHTYDLTFDSADGLLAHSSNVIAVRTVNKFSADQYAFNVEDDSIYQGAGWVVGSVSLG